jgi:hypothetical protein
MCPNVVASMSTTRMTFGSKNEFLWIDFSSWLRFGIAGMYVIGTLKLEEECSDVKVLCSDAAAGPSKYFACLSDISSNAFNVAFSEEEKKNLQLFDAYPIIRPNDKNIYNNYHKMVTVAEFAKEIDNFDESY